MRVAGVHRVGGGLANVRRGDEIRIAAAEIDDVNALRLELPGLVGNRQGGEGAMSDTRGEKIGGSALSSCGTVRLPCRRE